MSLAALMSEPVTVQHVDVNRAVVDTVTTTAYIEPIGQVLPDSEEPWVVASETYRTTWRLFVPAGTDIDAADRVVVEDGTIYEVVDAHGYRNARSNAVSHIEATLTRIAPADVLITVLRPDTTGDNYHAEPTLTTVAQHVRAWLIPVTGSDSTWQTQEVVIFQLRCDPVDVRHYDRILNEETGETMLVQWVHRVGTAAGRAHMEGEVKLVVGMPPE